MALGAHEVPVLVVPGPVVRPARLDGLVRIEVVPALLHVIPGGHQALQAATGQRHQVLLQRADAEHIVDAKIGGDAVGTGRVDPEGSLPAEETGRDPIDGDDGIIEIPQHRLFTGYLHGQLMVRAHPGPELVLVAAGAHPVVHETGFRGCGGGSKRIGSAGLAGSPHLPRSICFTDACPAASGIIRRATRQQHQAEQDQRQFVH